MGTYVCMLGIRFYIWMYDGYIWMYDGYMLMDDGTMGLYVYV